MMMHNKIAILGDVHLGVRADSLAFHNSFREFYSNIFFPYLLKNNIRHIIQLGDLFDRRKYISFQTLALSKKYFFDKLVQHNIECHVLLGNHDIFFKNTLEINSPELLLQEYSNNVFVYNKPAAWQGMDIIPWICKDNEQEIMNFIQNSSNEICFGHFELQGFEMDRGNICNDGMNPSILQRYEKVFSGHFHHKSSRGNITYVGTPSEHTWSDYNDDRGFHIFDIHTRECKFILNSNKMFYKIYYNDDQLFYDDIVNEDYSYLENKFVKIVIEKRNNSFLFDTLLDTLAKVNPLEVSVVEDFSEIIENVDVNVDQAEDTMTILNKYVDGLTLPVESDKIKTVLREVYNEALSMETA